MARTLNFSVFTAALKINFIVVVRKCNDSLVDFWILICEFYDRERTLSQS